MNWGFRIVIGMATALSAVVATGIYMVSQDHDSLESADYYERGLRYDQAYERRENVLRHQAGVQLQIDQDQLHIRFRQDGNRGIIRLQRPSDQRLDRETPFEINGSLYELSTRQLPAGLWRLHIEWSDGGVAFEQETSVYLP